MSKAIHEFLRVSCIPCNDPAMLPKAAFPEDLHLGKGACINKINGPQGTTKITKLTEKFCKTLGITLVAQKA